MYAPIPALSLFALGPLFYSFFLLASSLPSALHFFFILHTPDTIVKTNN